MEPHARVDETDNGSWREFLSRAGGSLPNGVVRETVNALGLALAGGRWSPGSKLPHEGELAEELGVGRNALREAVKVLAGKGLIRTARRYGTSVRERSEWNLLDPDVLAWHLADRRNYTRFLRDVSELRSFIEPNAAALAAERATPEEAAHILTLARRLETVPAEEAVEIDVALHLAVLAATHNALLSGFRRALEVVLRAQFAASLNSIAGEHAYDPNPAIHTALALAIQGGRAEEARHISSAMLARARHAADALDREAHLWTAPARGSTQSRERDARGRTAAAPGRKAKARKAPEPAPTPSRRKSNKDVS
jgi:DNA-binding FadR family transcriptional regulator